MIKTIKPVTKGIIYAILSAMTLLFVAPILIILINSFKGKLYISQNLFAMINSENFAGVSNYVLGFTRMNFLASFSTSLFITVCSTLLIILLCSMTSWYLVRVKNKMTSVLYYMFVFAMIVPFQMVMFTMSWMSNRLSLGNPVGILLLYAGFGASMSVFILTGFIKSIPLDIEEAAIIDGCNPLQTFFRVVFPVMKPTVITVAILNAMWIWNDYLLPLLVLDSKYSTLPIAIQKIFTGSYGGKDMGGLMAMLVLSIIPIIIFYLAAQKHIIEGVVAGAVKG
ncbi:carbohydrate ABC transporter permease [Hydrogenoanaerobacterium sp.]|uniref:carbohydrate ABC transporter permease n=1 Tax=Hydrogenoanaerobacterium sp. TaxID=2953763 RepID=UPI0028999BEA|nr:carbohydrate ABC transporter permease [Hydrogenoanaerobacterium sp.]